MSSQEAAESRQRAPRELLRSFLGTKMKLREAQKSCPEALKSLENNQNIKNSDVHETIENSMKIIDFPSSEGHL